MTGQILRTIVGLHLGDAAGLRAIRAFEHELFPDKPPGDGDGVSGAEAGAMDNCGHEAERRLSVMIAQTLSGNTDAALAQIGIEFPPVRLTIAGNVCGRSRTCFNT
jgi:hypothetical protein